MTRDELQRLIDLIVSELTMAGSRPQRRCACHAVVDDCCPDRLRGVIDAGIVIDGAGIGSAIAANKVHGVRAVMAMNETIARYGRAHNGANVLTLGATLVSADEARAIVTTWLTTPMKEPRYIQRLAKIRAVEDRG